jgi:hypothetical protein
MQITYDTDKAVSLMQILKLSRLVFFIFASRSQATLKYLIIIGAWSITYLTGSIYYTIKFFPLRLDDMERKKSSSPDVD